MSATHGDADPAEAGRDTKHGEAVVVYESMFGNTREIAEAIADGLAGTMHVRTLSVDGAKHADLDAVDLLVIGGPTHSWSMSRPNSRISAAKQANKPKSGLTLEPGSDGDGVREFVATAAKLPNRYAAFDTHMRAPLRLSGSAARALDRRLRRRGGVRAATPQQFLVTKWNVLEHGELGRAREWGSSLASTGLSPRARG